MSEIVAQDNAQSRDNDRGVGLPSVELVNVTKQYPRTDSAAVAGVSLVVEEGEFFSLLGPSGSGKTTTLRLIAGFERPSDGIVRLGGRDVTSRPPNRRDVNTVFQSYALFPHMSVQQNIEYPLKNRRVSRDERQRRALAALEQVEMRGFENRLPHQLSGGQRQRVALARALVGRPRVLLLDEPLGALDLKLRQSMQLVLKHLQREVGITFIYVTHDQGEALAMSDRIAVMHMGRFEQIGTPREIYDSPVTRFVATFIGDTNILYGVREGNGFRTTGGLLVRGAETNGSAEASCSLSIRPEAIRLAENADDLPNVFDVTIRDVIFLGSEQHIFAAAGNGEILRFKGLPEASYSVGQHLQVGWDCEATVILQG